MKIVEKLILSLCKEERIPVGRYRAILLDQTAEEVSDGVVKLMLYYVLISCTTGKFYELKETIVNDLKINRSRQFFKFLHQSKVVYENYEELIGMVIDADVVYENIDGKDIPILVRRKLVARPNQN